MVHQPNDVQGEKVAVYIESHQELGRHPKVARLAKALGISKVTAIGHLQYLWWWALDYAPDGILGRFQCEEIADGACWEGIAEAFVLALLDARFIDDTEDYGYVIHDWDQYGGKLIAKRKADAARKSVERAGTKPARPTDIQRTSNGHPRDGAGREDKNRLDKTNTPPYPPQGVPCGDELCAGDLNGTAEPGLPSDCLKFKADYPQTNHPTSDRELRLAWNTTCHNGQDVRRVMAGLREWKQTEQWKDPQHVPSMKSFLRGGKYENPPPLQPPQVPYQLPPIDPEVKRMMEQEDAYHTKH